MGYATIIYAVDLDALRAAVGSRNAGLIQSAKAAASSEEDADEMDPTKGPRIKVTKDSELFLNGQPVSFDELIAALHNPVWKGTNLYLYQEDGGKRSGVFRKLGSFVEAFHPALPPNHYIGTLCCNDDAELLSGWQDDDISEDQALRELIAGEFTRPDCAHQYGYALERLCPTLGTWLATIEGKGRLRALKLETPLSEARPPAPLPEIPDFPYISYLTAEEVQGEVQRLRSIDLSYPKNAEIEQDRKAFYKCLTRAAKKQVGIVSFYY